jgi:hypothetical protein
LREGNNHRKLDVEVEARADAALIKGLVRRAVEDIIDIGRALNRQRDALHGSFLPWVDAEFGWQERMAQRFMSIATKFEMANPSHLTGLSMLALTELAMPSTPPEVQAEVERRIAAGEIAALIKLSAAPLTT